MEGSLPLSERFVEKTKGNYILYFTALSLFELGRVKTQRGFWGFGSFVGPWREETSFASVAGGAAFSWGVAALLEDARASWLWVTQPFLSRRRPPGGSRWRRWLSRWWEQAAERRGKMQKPVPSHPQPSQGQCHRTAGNIWKAELIDVRCHSPGPGRTRAGAQPLVQASGKENGTRMQPSGSAFQSRWGFFNEELLGFESTVVRVVDRLSAFQKECPSHRASQVALLVKNPPASVGEVRDTGSVPPRGRSPGGGHAGGGVTHSSTPAWRIPTDRAAWQAAVHGVPKGCTHPKWLSAAQHPSHSEGKEREAIGIQSKGSPSRVCSRFPHLRHEALGGERDVIPRGRLDRYRQPSCCMHSGPCLDPAAWRNKDEDCSGAAGAVGPGPWVELLGGCWQLQRSQGAAVGLEILLAAKTASDSWSHAPSPPPTSAPFLAGDHLKGEFKMTQCLRGKELWLFQTELPETFRKLKKERKSEMLYVWWMACLDMVAVGWWG